jgi:hypothetical protein
MLLASGLYRSVIARPVCSISAQFKQEKTKNSRSPAINSSPTTIVLPPMWAASLRAIVVVSVSIFSLFLLILPIAALVMDRVLPTRLHSDTSVMFATFTPAPPFDNSTQVHPHSSNAKQEKHRFFMIRSLYDTYRLIKDLDNRVSDPLNIDGHCFRRIRREP